MGQFFAIGLATEMYIQKCDLAKCKIDYSCIIENMQNQLHFNPQIFECCDDDDQYILSLKHDVLKGQLIPFLNDFYPKIYQNPIMFDEIIEKLKSIPSEGWLEWASSKPEDAFQLDEHGKRDVIIINHNYVSIDYVTLLLSMEGKIALEINKRHFAFFKYCMLQAFSEYSLIGAIRVYITG